MNVFLLCRYLFRDFFFNLKNKSPHLYGIYGYLGLWGQGKTVSMTLRLVELREKYGNGIYIATNYGFSLQDFALSDINDIYIKRDKPCVYAFDEIQNDFESRSYRSFPPQLLSVLTQNRKGNGVMLLYTSQRFDRIDKAIRELTYTFTDCRTYFGRLTRNKVYLSREYERFDKSLSESRVKIKPIAVRSFVQTDELRSYYDTLRFADSLFLKSSFLKTAERSE